MAAAVLPIDLSAIPASAHEQAMRLAIVEARGVPSSRMISCDAQRCLLAVASPISRRKPAS